MRRSLTPFAFGVVVTLLAVCIAAVWDEGRPAMLTINIEFPGVSGMESEDKLDRDAAYVGSMTFAGLALFGSTILLRALGVTKHDSWMQKLGALLVIGGTWALIIIHVNFAFGLEVLLPSVMIWITICLAGMIVIGGGVVYHYSKEPPRGEPR